MSDEPSSPSSPPVPVRNTEDKHNPTNGYPPMEVMHRMLDLQERKLDIDSRQLDINEKEMEHNKELAFKSMEYNATANVQNHAAMQRVMGWRYIFWGVVIFLSCVAVITALVLGKETFVLEALKYLAVFIGGYGTKAAVGSKKKNAPTEEVE